jgi:CDP-diacylglycerol--glycerol-3-phosphate 3-phosphatidyltransferase
MLTNLVRRWGNVIIDPIARIAGQTGISPNGITFIGFLLTSVVASLLAGGYLQLAGILLIVAALFDAIDGSMARQFQRTTSFGAFLDSTTDRFSEAVLFLGVLIHFQEKGANTEVILTYVAIVGSLMVSYTRARAEGIGVSIKGGLLTRFERIVVLIAGLLSNQLTIALWILAVLTNFTALQRIWLTWQATRGNTRNIKREVPGVNEA